MIFFFSKTFLCNSPESQLRHVGYLVVAYELSVATCRIQFPDQGLNPGPWQWRCQVLTARPPGSSPHFMILMSFSVYYFKNIYYLAAQGLSCGVWDLQLWHVNPLIVARGTWFPDQGVSPGAQSLSPWTTREVPGVLFFLFPGVLFYAFIFILFLLHVFIFTFINRFFFLLCILANLSDLLSSCNFFLPLSSCFYLEVFQYFFQDRFNIAIFISSYLRSSVFLPILNDCLVGQNILGCTFSLSRL